jgi:hypothetical protein
MRMHLGPMAAGDKRKKDQTHAAQNMGQMALHSHAI